MQLKADGIDSPKTVMNFSLKKVSPWSRHLSDNHQPHLSVLKSRNLETSHLVTNCRLHNAQTANQQLKMFQLTQKNEYDCTIRVWSWCDFSNKQPFYGWWRGSTAKNQNPHFNTSYNIQTVIIFRIELSDGFWLLKRVVVAVADCFDTPPKSYHHGWSFSRCVAKSLQQWWFQINNMAD